MTTVKIEKIGDFAARLIVTGHTGYAEDGKDIVCAAVSAIAQTAVLGLRAFGVNPKVKTKDGFLDISVSVPKENETYLAAKAILETAILGLKDIHEGYPAFVGLEE